jgi:hypothetical protein
MLKSLLLILVSLLVFSCGSNSDEKLKEVILDAQIALGSGNCQYAIDVLESNGRVSTNAHYVKTLASAYACRAGYSTPTFFTSDLIKTVIPFPLGGTTLYSTSKVAVTSPLETDAKFEDLQMAITILLYAGGIPTTANPTAYERSKHFTSDQAADINSQLLFMELVQFGKFLRVYGNGSALGVKGGGVPAANKCFSTYNSDPLVVGPAINTALGLSLVTGACKMNTSGHAELATTVGATVRKRRMCHGVVLINGTFNVLDSVMASATGGALGTISGIDSTVIAGFKTVVTGAFPTMNTTVFDTMNQTTCESEITVPILDLEKYYALFAETLFRRNIFYF